MVEVRWTQQAIEDINAIAVFIAQDSEKYASIQVERFFEAVIPIISNPKIGRVVPEISNESIREVILGNYRLIYFIKSHKTIDVLTVHHSRRLLQNNPAM